MEGFISLYIYKYDTDRLLEQEESLMKRLMPVRHQKAIRLGNPAVRMESIAAGLLLGYAFERHEGDFFYNISHDNEVAVVAVSSAPVGVDIEFRDDKSFRVTEKKFCPSERDYVLGADEAERQFRFRRIWTMKEAYLKYTTEGLTVPLDTVWMDMDTLQVLRRSEEGIKETGAYIAGFPIVKGYDKGYISICSGYEALREYDITCMGLDEKCRENAGITRIEQSENSEKKENKSVSEKNVKFRLDILEVNEL